MTGEGASYPPIPLQQGRSTKNRHKTTDAAAPCELLPEHHAHHPRHPAGLSHRMSYSAMGRAVPLWGGKRDLLSPQSAQSRQT